MPSDARLVRQYAMYSQTIAIVSAVIGALVLVGWAFDIAQLESIVPGFITMKPLTAIGFVMIGIALLLLQLRVMTPRRDTVARALAVTVSAMGAFVLIESFLEWDPGIDSLFVVLTRGALAARESLRMGIVTAGSFVATGVSLWALGGSRRGERAIASLIAFGVALAGFFTLLPYLYGEPQLFALHPRTWISLHSAILFIAIGAGIVAARPEESIAAQLTDERAGGWMARRMLPVAICLPLIVGYFRLAGQRRGLYGTEVGLAIFAATNILVFAGVIWYNARALNTIDQRREVGEGALRKSEELFSKAFHSNPAAMGFLRLRDFAYIDVNDAWLALTGRNRDENVGGELQRVSLVAHAKRDQLAAQLRRGESLHDLELEISTKSGLASYVLLSAQPVTVDGEAHSLVVMLDITGRKRAEEEQAHIEEQLRQSQKLQALGTLAAGIAHDFNNILAIVVGNAQILRQELPRGDAAQVGVGEIYAAGLRATDLVRRILTFGRREDANRHAVSLRDVVHEGLQLLRPMLPTSIEVRTKVDLDTPIVLADPAQLHQVILNLGTNAGHAMGEAGGILEFDLQPIVVSAELAATSPGLKQGEYALLSVSDTGSGIDAETLERVFEPFFTTKAPGVGTGLGLAVVHGVMQNHGGAVTVYSERGRGTIFRLYFPATTDGIDASPARSDVVEEAGNGEHVLYIDDEKALVFLAERQLTSLGYRVTSSTDPVKALELFRANPMDFDAVVTDISMPGMSGIELAKAVLEIRQDIPLVITSGYIRDEDVRAAAAIGILNLILKPNTVGELGSTLHRLLSVRLRKPDRMQS
jgi:PAS domain S-box-containing protein